MAPRPPSRPDDCRHAPTAARLGALLLAALSLLPGPAGGAQPAVGPDPAARPGASAPAAPPPGLAPGRPSGTAPPGTSASPTLARMRSRGELRVCIWPDYYGITWRNPHTQRLVGLDIDLSEALAARLGLRLQHVESSFVTLVEDLRSARCDIAMFAVGVLPQRAAQLAFARPYLRSGIYGVSTRSNRVVQRWDDIDQPGVQVGVQAGTFMEPVMAASLRHATLVRIHPPVRREQELAAGRIDVFMTDYPYSRRLLDNADWARLIAPPQPFHPLPYAHAVAPGDALWLAQVDAFVAGLQRDGRLRRLATRHGLGEIVVAP